MEKARASFFVERKLQLTYLLNVTDWICTLALLSTGRFYEANPIARMFIGNIGFGFAVKCVLPLMIVAVIIRVLRRAEADTLRTADSFVSFVMVFYLVIAIDHTINFMLLIFL